MPPATPILQADNLVKIFGEFTALDGLSFAVGQGESLGLLGVNGAGKTTAMNLLLGLTTPTSGTVRIFGLEFWKHRIEILRQINFSSAYTSLPSNLLVWQNLTVFAKLYGVPRPKQRIEALLEQRNALPRRRGHVFLESDDFVNRHSRGPALHDDPSERTENNAVAAVRIAAVPAVVVVAATAGATPDANTVVAAGFGRAAEFGCTSVGGAGAGCGRAGATCALWCWALRRGAGTRYDGSSSCSLTLRSAAAISPASAKRCAGSR